MKLYSLRSKSMNYLNVPFVANDDTEVLIQIRDAIQKGQDSSLVRNLEDIEIVILAEFSPSSGLVARRNQLLWNDDVCDIVPDRINYDLTKFAPVPLDRKD
ncbi:hypothetical protein [Microvirus mar31]|uniref:Uncharacterized protein n=1 Tax=Microvirus mar31 TaxID=2851165 RepID=A0A8F5MLK4_9VIRU|nr:hypothetical protein [Microvirus mar31]